jgi:alanine dehydrogenase
MQTTLIDGSTVESVPMSAIIPAVEDAFAAYEREDVQMPAKSYVDLPQYNGDFRSMPAYMDAGDWDAAAVKWVNVHPDNPDDHGLPTVMGLVIYSDPETGFPLAVVDGTVLTRKRTGAAAAVATDHLAVDGATSLGIVGAGIQSYTQLTAISAVRPIETVVVSDVDDAATQAFIDTFPEFDVRAGSVREAAACDVLSTVTPVREPIVDAGMTADHTHINAMGADAPGKHELADGLLTGAKIVIDDYEQTTHSGEINVPWAQGTLGDEDIYAELGEIVTGTKPGRTESDGVTVFDSTGLAIQDVATAHVVYEDVGETGSGRTAELVGTGTRG